MKKWILHIYIIGLLTSILVSCSSTLDEEIIREQDGRVGISFTMSLNSVGAASRSLSSDMVAQYENMIAQDKFRVLAYTTDGNMHEVTIFSMNKISESTYEISGELTGKHLVNKVMVLANCDKSFNPFISSLNLLTYNYSDGSDFNPESPRNYIPMWGVKAFKTTLEPGTNTNIGTINLLRAMAKVQVALSDQSFGCELTQVKMTRYNDTGACVPGSFENVDETDDVDVATVPDDVMQGSDLAFHQVGDKSYMLYLPEYININNQNSADITVSVNDVNNVTRTKTFKIGKYSSNGEWTGTQWDILRNHYYKFDIFLKVSAEGKLNLEVKTEKYAEFDLKPAYGDD